MRNQALTGYLLHQKPYQERRALCYLFSKEFGMIHGVSKKGVPLFERLQLFATGKRSLKNFSQIQLAIHQPPISGSQQYAALYLNEVLYRLLPVEDPMPELWRHYDATLTLLRQPVTTTELRLYLRAFERRLFAELGHEILLTLDNNGASIQKDCQYRFNPESGFELAIQSAPSIKDGLSTNNEGMALLSIFNGDDILQMDEIGLTTTTVMLWSRLYRLLIDHLLDYKPLQSRLLWQQQQRYQ